MVENRSWGHGDFGCCSLRQGDSLALFYMNKEGFWRESVNNPILPASCLNSTELSDYLLEE
nr:MAG TPA: hypothetical protein [Caudoviricetes sp.]